MLAYAALAASVLRSQKVVIGATISLVISSALVLTRAGLPMLFLFPAIIYACTGLIAGDQTLQIFLGSATCDLQLYALIGIALVGIIVAGLTFHPAFGRVLRHVGLGFGTGAYLGLLTTGLLLAGPPGAGEVGPPGTMSLLAALFVGVVGAALMYACLPLSVKERAVQGKPNLLMHVDLPYAQRDVFLELLSPTNPLGAAGEFHADKTAAAEHAASGTTKQICQEGALRKCTLPSGSMESVLLHAFEPVRIVWKQTASHLRGINMHGGGSEDEPGLKLELTGFGTFTRVSFEYFFCYLTEGPTLFTAPSLEAIDSAALQQKMSREMAARGYTPLTEQGASASMANQKLAVKKDATADEMEAAAIKARAAPGGPPKDMPPPATLPSPGRAPLPGEGKKSML